MNASSLLLATRIDGLSVEDLDDDAAWRESAEPVILSRYWSGDPAPATRHAEARALWNDDALIVRFVCRQSEPLIINSVPQIEHKTIGLWERDVCEIFIAPQSLENYYEFEVAPTGEWLDLKIRANPDGRITDWEFTSGMKAAARVNADQIILALAVPWNAFGHKPTRGDQWRANLFRCVGSGESRGYLAWQPTRTPAPNFHVPAVFGELVFQ